jgi:hypothetical protein
MKNGRPFGDGLPLQGSPFASPMIGNQCTKQASAKDTERSCPHSDFVYAGSCEWDIVKAKSEKPGCDEAHHPPGDYEEQPDNPQAQSTKLGCIRGHWGKIRTESGSIQLLSFRTIQPG